MARNGAEQRIRTTAENLFSRYGVRRVTVQEICRTAGVSKVSFYKHYRNKHDLVDRIRDDLIAEGFAAYDEISARDIPYPEKVDLMTRWRAEHLASLNDEFRRELFANPEVEAQVKKRFLANMSQARDQGHIRADIAGELVWLVSEKLQELVREGSWKQAFPDYEEFQKQMRRLFFYGLLSRPEGDGDPPGGE